MAWTDVDIYDVNLLMTAATMNALKDNINYVHAPNAASYQHPGSGGNYTITSSSSLGTDVDSTNFNLAITTFGGPVLGCFYGNIGTSDTSTSVRMNITHVSSVTEIGRNLFNNFAAEVISTATTGETRGFMVEFIGLPAGSHTFKLVWGVSGAGTGTLYVALRPTMCVWEA